MKPSRADGQTWTNNNFFHQDNAIATTVSTREKRKQNVGFKVFKGNLTTFIIADTTEEKKLFTAGEKFRHFIELNPVVADLKSIFGLELD